MVESYLECNSSTSQPYALLRSLSVWFCGPECLRQQKLSSSCVHHHIRILQPAGRVLRVQGRSFQDKCPLAALLKRGCVQKNSFHFSSKKRGARVARNRSGHEHQSAAVGRVLRVQASSFQERRVMTALKRGCVQKNSFHFSSKKRGARVACNRSGHCYKAVLTLTH